MLDRKRETRPNDYDQAVIELYAEGGRFAEMLNEQLSRWDGIVEGKDIPALINNWLSTQKLPEELTDAVSIES